jgi:cysteine-rich repeat protein
VERCGDRVLDPQETCDDGNTLSGDGCRGDCRKVEHCPDGTVDAQEECDDGNTVTGDGCRPDCTVEVCGDLQRDPGEACDDGNHLSGDGCRPDCLGLETCGDHLLDPGEACDDGNTVSGDGCWADCGKAERCGDRVLDPQETCDDGNTVSGDGCRGDCGKVERCGDGLPDHGEECDEGEDNDDDAPDACRTSCRRAGCGDGVVDAAESCDDGNTTADDGCSPACAVESCGDGALQTGRHPTSLTFTWLGQGCGESPSDVVFTVNGVEVARVPGASEVCACAPGVRVVTLEDEPTLGLLRNGQNTLGVAFPGAGDLLAWAVARVQSVLPQEVVLHDANGGGDAQARNPDLCAAGADPAVATEVTARLLLDESCDDGGTEDGDGCSSDCNVESCGDGVRVGAEECDDGNTGALDGCSPGCRAEACGDGAVQPQRKPRGATLEWLATSCDGASTLTFLANQRFLGAARLGPVQCGCRPGAGRLEVTDPVALHAFQDGPNDVAVRVDGSPVQAAWVTLTLDTWDDLPTFTLLDVDGGEDAESHQDDLCLAGAAPAEAWVTSVALTLPPEECDDGNPLDGDGCTATFLRESCGNRRQEGWEECDDGNTVGEDGCGPTCLAEFCGDGAIQARPRLDAVEALWLASTCDPDTPPLTLRVNGNLLLQATVDDTCSCTPRLDGVFLNDPATLSLFQDGVPHTLSTSLPGDGQMTAWVLLRLVGTSTQEVVLHDAGSAGDALRRTADLCEAGYDTNLQAQVVETIRLQGEGCDDGNLQDGDGCSATCVLESCGDADLQGAEECDDGNTLGDDGCSPTCRVERCGDGVVQAPVSPTALRFQWLADNCGPAPAPLSFALGGQEVAATQVPSGCDTCTHPAEVTDVTDPAVLAALAAGPVTLSVSYPSVERDAPLSWVLATAVSPTRSPTFVLFEARPGDAARGAEDWCAANGVDVRAETTLSVNETCDDGNTTAGDGCSALCRLEP